MAVDFSRLMQIQTDLNDFTLSEKKVYIPHTTNPVIRPTLVLASSSLKQRTGSFTRHTSGLIRMLDMYQWAGNRELLELEECLTPIQYKTSPKENAPTHRVPENRYENARIEVIDIMHFDLSLLALTCATAEEIEEGLKEALEDQSLLLRGIERLRESRALFDDLQLTKWWTTNQVSVEEIRKYALSQFADLLHLGIAEKFMVGKKRKTLFEDCEDVEATYLKKVKVNYERIKNQYDHVKDAEMGNNKVK